MHTIAGGRFCAVAELGASSRDGPTALLRVTAGWLSPHHSAGSCLIPWELVQLDNPTKNTFFFFFFPPVDLAHQEARGVPEQEGVCDLRHSSCLAELSTYVKKTDESNAVTVPSPSNVSELFKWLCKEGSSCMEAVVQLGDVH